MTATAWTFDPAHTTVDFRIRHAAISWVRGSFKTWTGTLDFDPSNPEGVSVEFAIDVDSVDTGVADRDTHLRSGDFFDVEKYPTMTFVSTGAAAVGGDRYRLAGDLSLHGVMRPVTFDVVYGGHNVDPWGAERVGFEATAVLDRRDFGLVWNQTMEEAGVLIGDTVEVTLVLEAVKA